MSYLELNALVSDAVSVTKAVFSSKQLLISANSDVCVADDLVQDDSDCFRLVCRVSPLSLAKELFLSAQGHK